MIDKLFDLFKIKIFYFSSNLSNLYVSVAKKIFQFIILKNENIKSNYTSKDGHNVFIIVGNSHTFKIALYRKTKIHDELKKINLILAEYNQFQYIFNRIEFKNIYSVKYLKSETLYPISPDNILNAAKFLYKMVKGKNNIVLKISDLPEITCGLEIIEKKIKKDFFNKIENLIKKHLETCNFTVGFCHGDFHKRNIMADLNGNFKYIDYDCIRINGIQEIDCLYFLHDYYWDFYENNWQTTVADFFEFILSAKNEKKITSIFELKIDPTLLLLYFLDRVGQEYLNENITINEKVVNEIVTILLRQKTV